MIDEPEVLPLQTRLALDSIAQGLVIKALIATHPDPARVRALASVLLPLAEETIAEACFLGQGVTPEQMLLMREWLRQSLDGLLKRSPP